MIIYIFLCFVTSSFAIEFDCLKGPSFWCLNNENARRCGRTVECFVTNQNSGVAKMSRSSNVDYCLLCKSVVVELEKDVIPAVSVGQFIEYVVTKVCPVLGVDLREACVTLVRQYGLEIYKELFSFLDPAKVCSYINLCKSQERGKITLPRDCKTCKEVLAFLRSLVEKVTPGELRTILKLVLCAPLPPSVNLVCTTLVDGYTDQVYELLKSLLDGDRMCSAFHLCDSSKYSNYVSTRSEQKTCIDMVTSLKKELENIPKEKMSQLVNVSVCFKVPDSLKETCISLLGENVDQFMKFVYSSIIPVQICAQKSKGFGISLKKEVSKKSLRNIITCGSCEMLVKEGRKWLLTKKGAEDLKNLIKTRICGYLGKERQRCKDLVDLYGDILINIAKTQVTDRQICDLLGACSGTKALYSKSTSPVQDIKCETCELVLTRIKSYLSDPTHQASLKQFIKKSVCPLFKNESAECLKYVDEYFLIVVNALLNEFDVKSFCQSGGFCPKMSNAVIPNGEESVKCTLCESVMSELISKVVTNESSVRMETFIKNVVCPKLNSLKDECNSVVSKYWPYMFAFVQKKISGELICSRLHICALVVNKHRMDLLSTRSKDSKTVRCDLCNMVVKETVFILSQSSVQTELRSFLEEEICPLFGNEKKKCQEDISEYYSLIINLLIHFLTPDVCQEIGLCESVPSKHMTISDKDFECHVCPKVYNYMKTITEKTSKIDVIINLVGICSLYNQEDRQRCLDLLRKSDALIAGSQVARSEEEYCKTSGMCSSKDNGIILGLDKCVWGPGFWCISRMHAQLCGVAAVRHCELKVWK